MFRSTSSSRSAQPIRASSPNPKFNTMNATSSQRKPGEANSKSVSRQSATSLVSSSKSKKSSNGLRKIRKKKKNRALGLKTPKHIRLQRDARKEFKFRFHHAYESLIEYVFNLRDGVAQVPFVRASMVWYPHKVEGYIPAKVLESFEPGTIGHMVIIENDEARTVQVTKRQSRNLLRMDSASVSAIENMNSITDLNEAAILYNLRLRFRQGENFAVVGSTEDLSRQFQRTGGRDSRIAASAKPDPFTDATILLLNTFTEPASTTRVFVRKVCYNLVANMIKARRHQALIFQGESSSGKTHFMREFVYQLTMQRRKHKEKNLLFLEAIKGIFGASDAFLGAKTLRNRKATRGGKIFDVVHTLSSGRVVGGRIKLMFLDKTRVASRRRGEDNFAILYQLCAHATMNEKFRKSCQLLFPASHCKYLYPSADGAEGEHLLDQFGPGNSLWPTLGDDGEYTGGEVRVTTGVKHDSQRWERLTTQLKECFGVTDASLLTITTILSAVINLGNVRFVGHTEAMKKYEYDSVPPHGTAADETVDIANPTVLGVVASQLGVDQRMLEHVLMVKDIRAGNEVLTRALTVAQSEMTRDALAKFLYERVLVWLEVMMNHALSPPKNNEMQADFWNTVGSVKLLDFIGFESFERSSFEHLCVNYYNEGLNIHFQAFIARMERQRVVDFSGIETTSSKFESPTAASLASKVSHTRTPSGPRKVLSEFQQKYFSVETMKRGLSQLASRSFGTSKKNSSREPDEGVFPLFTKRRVRGRLGVFDIVNEIGKLRDGGSDHKVLVKLQTEFPSDSKYVRRPRENIPRFKECFTVIHFAGAVNYTVEDFLAKNYAALPQDLEFALWNSSDDDIRAVCALDRLSASDDDAVAQWPIMEKADSWEPVWHKLSPKVAKSAGPLNTRASRAGRGGADNQSVASFSSFRTTDTSHVNSNSFQWDSKAKNRTLKKLQLRLAEEANASLAADGAGRITAEKDEDISLSTVDEHNTQSTTDDKERAPPAVLQKDPSVRFGNTSVAELRKTFNKKTVPELPVPEPKPVEQVEVVEKKPAPIVKEKRKRIIPLPIDVLTETFRFFPPKTHSKSTLDQLLVEYSELVTGLNLASSPLPRTDSMVRWASTNSQDADAAASGHDVRFVKCIKINSLRQPGLFDPLSVLGQLRKCGLVDMCNLRETIGYPVQIDFINFMQRYSVLMPRVLWRPVKTRQDVVDSILAVLKNMERMHIMTEESYVVGMTGVMMRHEAYQFSEVARHRALTDMSVFVQKYVRCWIQRAQFLRVMKIKIEIELEANTDSRSITGITKWIESAKRYKVFTLPYYQAIGRLERLYKEKEVRRELVAAVKSRDTILLYNAIRRAEEMHMADLDYPELSLAKRCQFEIEDERRDEINALIEDYKLNYRDVISELNDNLQDEEMRKMFETFKDEEIMKTKKPKKKKKAVKKKQSSKSKSSKSKRASAEHVSDDEDGETSNDVGLQVAVDHDFLDAFYRKVGAEDKLQEIDFILGYFEDRPSDLVHVIESKYSVKFNPDGSFVKVVPQSLEVLQSDPVVMEEGRKSEFVKDLATARGVANKDVRLRFQSEVPANFDTSFLEEADESDDESYEEAAFEDEQAWHGARRESDDTNSVTSD